MAEEEISTQAESETIDTITINELDANTQIQATDIILTRDTQGRDRKATMAQVKEFSYPPAAGSTQAGLVTTEAQTFKGMKTFENDVNVQANLAIGGENVKDIIANSHLYKAGDTFAITSVAVVPAYVTTNGTLLRLTIPLHKSMKNVTPTINSLKANIRASAGSNYGYVGKSANPSYVDGGTEYASDAECLINDNLLTVRLLATNKWYVGSVNNINNYPVIVEINSMSITFN